MGLIKAAMNAVSGTLADQWKEYFYCDTLPANVLAVRAEKREGGRNSNKKGTDNIITTGSVIAVADGQCMIVVEQGKVLDVCAEPGEFVFEAGGEPSLFIGGDFAENAIASLESAWQRFKFGGMPGKDTRVYYINTKELIGNKYGTPNPVPFRVVDTNIGLDVDISIRCHGEYSYRITNPILFYTNVCGNITNSYTRDALDGQLKTELMTALQPAFAKISAMGIRYSMLPGHTMELADALNDVLSTKWRDLRGLEIVSLGVSSVNASKEDEEMIKTLQKSAVMRDPGMAAATLVGAQADAMRAAASNTATGPMMAFAGMNMAAGAGGMNAQSLFEMQNQQKAAAGQPWQSPTAAPPAAQQPATGWTCACGVVNKGKFCSECGTPKPAGALLYKCDKCGWEPEDPTKPPKFCPECGDVFDESDVK